MKIPIIATALALAFSSAALAQDANSHAAHHPDRAQAAAQGPGTSPPPAAKPTGPAPAGTNCPMMGNGQANMMNGSMMGSKSAKGATGKSMNCQMTQQHPPHTMILHPNNSQ